MKTDPNTTREQEINDDNDQKNTKKKKAISWMERARQLYQFKLKHGHTLVPKGYTANPGLSVWVYKQRRLYKRMVHHQNQTNSDNNDNNQTTITTLTPQRIRILNELEFCWDAKTNRTLQNQTVATLSQNNSSHAPEQQQERQKKRRKSWWEYYDLLCEYCQNNKDDLFTLSRRVQPGIWLDRQRQLYRHKESESTTLTLEQIHALTQLHPDWWMTPREYQWECRYRELWEYPNTTIQFRPPPQQQQQKSKKQPKQGSRGMYMDTRNSTKITTTAGKVGEMETSWINETATTNITSWNGTQRRIRICAEQNPVLARWVHRQRREYRHRCAGLPSAMTDERIEKLERFGFVWFPWGNDSDVSVG